MSKFDYMYRRLLLTKFFTKGWGKPENLKRLFEFRKIISNRETCKHLVPNDYPVHITKDEVQNDCRVMEGYFQSPFTKFLPGIMPVESEKANFQIILPKNWKHGKLKPVCLHLAGTGDHFFWRRRTLMARPLLKEAGIASILLENPYYGERKPKYQLRSSLHNVSDLFVMGAALILESQVLLHWCENQGWGPLGITGISMGGHMASLAASNWCKPLTLVPCLSWSTASVVFTQGVMSAAIPWQVLESQYFEDHVYEQEIKKLIHSPEEALRGAYGMGKKFVSSFSSRHPDPDVNMDMKPGNIRSPSPGTPSVDIGARGFSSAVSLPPDGATVKTNQAAGQKVANWRTEPLTLQHASAKSKLFRVPFNGKSETASYPKTLKKEALQFMVGVMDECTHLGNFSVPMDPELIIIVAAMQDAYIPRDDVLRLDQLWPGSEVRYLDRGHVTAFLLNQFVFRKAIIDGFNRQIAKYYS
ncbi:protein ABHD18-like [Haliotis cracherodii]|uniref:protein ABHD18-like n=1 Tax=Haliotis cracherodii TaxID=6455 RepID=UPI0039E98021